MIKNKIKNSNFAKYFFVLILIFAILLLIFKPKLSMSTFYEGMLIWATKVLPALLPFFILTKLLSYTQFTTSLGNFLSPITKKLYGVGGVSGYIYIMSVISGYPVGAKLTSDFYTNKTISKTQATTITSFTSTSGPLFILGTVAIGLFNNSQMGLIILLSHYIGALLNGIIYRKKSEPNIHTLNLQASDNFLSESMTSSIISIMTVGGFIALFYMFLKLFLAINLFAPITQFFSLFNIDKNIITAIICGIIEVTTGAIYLSELSLSPIITTALLTFLISFGGISIHAQAYCFLKNFNMSYKMFLLQKTTQAIISTIICIPITLIM